MSKVSMTCKIILYGSLGNTKVFFAQKLYEFEESELKAVDAQNADKDDLGYVCLHYKFIENGNIFWIPGIYCAEYDQPIGLYNKPGQYGNVVWNEDMLENKADYERRKFSNEDMAKDFHAQSEEVLGRRITNQYAPDVSKELRKLRNGTTK